MGFGLWNKAKARIGRLYLPAGGLYIAGVQVTASAADLNEAESDAVFAAVVAAAGTNQATATLIASRRNVVTGADGTKGVRLPVGTVGDTFRIINNEAAQILKVYPSTGAAINGLGANNAFSLGPGREATFEVTSATQYYASGLAAGVASLAELDFVDGVTSAIQTQIDTKAPLASPTFTGVVTVPTPFTLGAVSVTPTGTELNFVGGVTSAIQTQLDGKQATITNPVVGDAAGYKISRSAAPVALDGSNPTSFAHGLTTCVAVFVQLVGSAAPALSTSVLTPVINGANIDVYAWKPTGAGDTTLTASTGTETFNWFAIGT